jgi:DNA-binding CsgD family transcriptional regulator
MRTVTSPVSVNLAILDQAGTICSVNEAWRRFGQRNGLRTPQWGLGTSYLDHCKGREPGASEAVHQIRKLLRAEVDLISFPYRCDSPRTKRAFVLIGLPLPNGEKGEVALLHLDIGAMFFGSHAVDEIAKTVEAVTADVIGNHIAGGTRTPPPGRAEDVPNDLTDREKAVLSLIGQGKTNNEIAAILSRSPNTVKIHVSNVLKKLNLRSRTEAALVGSRLALSEATK